ncbi:MAG: DUF4389 domain-containing protein [Acidimicrobiia bacterium]
MGAGKVVLAVVGGFLALVGLAVLVGGGALLYAWGVERDEGGFFTSPSVTLESAGHAVVSEEIDLGSRPGDVLPTGRFGTVRLEAAADDAAFIGIGPETDVADYLDGVAHNEVTRIDTGGVTYRSISGDATPAPPGDADFWVASAEGSGDLTVDWEVERGRWAVVAMNADGSAGVSVDVSAGVTTAWLIPVAIGLMVGGFLLAGLGAVFLIIAFVRPSGAPRPAAAPRTDLTYPVVVEGEIDPALSRWQWLVKWFLAIPHFIVLAFLWAGFVLLTFVAFWAILFTGRYPRGIFDFNVGVLRWSWRVAFYTAGMLATDQYPPFTLADVDYPARLDVEYPEELSRGLALVKWWLLAIPHYLIVGIFTSGLVWYTTELDAAGEAILETGGGLISILAFIAVIVLLFTGRYPRGLFDLLMGLHRWVFRVAAYASLMRDEYPPFRLDTGGDEPRSGPEPPATGPTEGAAATGEVSGT